MDLHLPVDIFLNIFSRLPIKSLLRCRCVSKTWRDLSLHPHLPNMHLSLAQSPNPTTFILYSSQLDLNSINTKLYYLEFDQTSCVHQPIRLQVPLESWLNRFTVVGSCNGLLCLLDVSSYYEDIFIFNPSIGDYIQLPQCGNGCQLFQASFGFGFGSTAASSDGEYKVVRIHSDATNVFLSTFVSSIKVYTLGDSVWRNVACSRDFKYYIDHKLPSVFVRGGLHWKCYEKVDRDEILGSVTCFNLRSEELSIIPFPDFINELDLMHKVSLVELNGCLSFYRTTFQMLSWYRITIWIMKDYGVKESWAKQFVIKDSVLCKPSIKYARPLCLNSEGEILLICGGKQLVAYDPRRKIYRELGYYEMLDPVKAVTHVGSLVPLKADNERGGHM